MAWVNRAGTVVGELANRTPSYFARLSPDGTRMVFDDYDAESRNTDLWLYDIRRDVTTRFTFEAADDLVPYWMPDGEQVLFSSNRNGQYELFQKAASGAEEARLLLADDFEIYPTGVSPDGRYVVLTCRKQNSKWDIYYTDLQGDRKAIPYLVTEFNEWLGTVSPDGRWLAYQSDESGKYEIYIRPFPRGGGKWQLSTGGGQGPIWSRDGREVFFDSENGKLMRVEVQTGDQTLRTGIPEPLFDLAGREQIVVLDVSSDGTRFVAEVSAIERSINPVTLVLNWQRDMERKFQ